MNILTVATSRDAQIIRKISRSATGPHTGLGLLVGMYFEPHGGVKLAPYPGMAWGSYFTLRIV